MFCARPRHRAAGDHRDPLHGARPRARRTRFYPYADRGRRARRRARPLPGDGLQERARRPRPRRRQGRDHRRPARDKTEALLRAYGRFVAVPRRPLRHRVRRRHLRRRHGRDRRECRWSSPAARRAHGGAGDSSRAHRARRLPGHAGRAPSTCGARRAGRPPVGIAGVGKVGPTWSSTCSTTARRSWSPTSTPAAVDRCAHATRRSRRSSRRDAAARRRRSTSTPPARSAAR